ncbi:RHS repeat-associated core domain-containing protein [Pseudomonas sp. H11T01]|uniref:RHS repeat-associated core domain-containing protein n=1 Tax=Pseudomonas sp. H11T01 TaxID=3402749 RepID=UPI003ACFF620
MPASPRETVLCRYHYDPLDRLADCALSAQADIQRFYCKSRLATEIQGAVQTSIFQHDDQLLAQLQRQDAKVDTTLLATDQQRSVLNALDATQPHPLAYTPYGHRPPENGLLSLLGFNGERPDPVTGHYHLGNGYRQFNPVLMRFNSPDSWSPFGEGGLNAYGYCVGDPVNTRDPTGHTPTILKYIFRKLGFMDLPSIKFTEQRLAKAQKNTLANIHTAYAKDKTPKDQYLALLKLDKTRQIDTARLLKNPELTSGRTKTFTKLETGKFVSTREHYSYLTLAHHSTTPTSPVPERVSRYTFSAPEFHEIERIVPEPSGGWKKVDEIRMPERTTLWSRRGSAGTTQRAP